MAKIKFKILLQTEPRTISFTLTETKANNSVGESIDLMPGTESICIIRIPIKAVVDSSQPPGSEFWVNIK